MTEQEEKDYQNLIKEKEELIKERDYAIEQYEHFTKLYNRVGYYMIETLGYTLQQFSDIAHKSREMQDVERLYNKKSRPVEIKLADVYKENKQNKLNEYEGTFGEYYTNEDLSNIAKVRYVKTLMEDMQDYFLLEDNPSKENNTDYLDNDIIDLYNELNDFIEEHSQKDED